MNAQRRPLFDGDAPLAPTSPGYWWRIEAHDPLVADRQVQEEHTCRDLVALITEVRQILVDFVKEGWYVVPIEHWTWCCSLMDDETQWVMVRYVIAEATSISPN